MYYKFEYQNDEYLINLDKISHIIKTIDEKYKLYRLFINVGENSLVFSFENKEKLEKFYDDLQSTIIEQEKRIRK